MTKQEFINAVAEESSVTKTDVEKVVKASLDTIQKELVNGGSITFTGFGTFSTKETKEREGVNPKTLEKIKIPKSRKVSFKVGKSLKDSVK